MIKLYSFKRLVSLLISAIILLTISGALFTQMASAGTGIPKILNHQGRLLNSTGDLLGGTGTNYCFKFSIYDAVSAGNKLWPTGTPSQMAVSVVNGVYNVGIGDTVAGGDALTLSFTGDTYYLNIDVALQTGGSCGDETYEALSPRQRVLSGSYAIGTQSLVYSNDSASTANGWLVNAKTGAAWTGNMFDVDLNAGISEGNVFDITYATAAHTGDALHISMGTNVAGNALVINSAGTSGNVMSIDASALTTGNIITIASPSTRTSGSILKITDAATATASSPTINISATGATDSPILNITASGGPVAGGNLIDLNISTVLMAANAIDIDFTGVDHSGAAIDITMDNNSMITQGLVITSGTGVIGDELVEITSNNTTGANAVMRIAHSGTRGGVLDFDVSGALITENVIDIDMSEAFTSNVLDINVGTTGTGSAIKVDGVTTIAPATTGTMLDFQLETEWTGGSLVVANFGSATTQKSAMTGMSVDLGTFLATTSGSSDIRAYHADLGPITFNAAYSGTLYGLRLEVDPTLTDENLYGALITTSAIFNAGTEVGLSVTGDGQTVNIVNDADKYISLAKASSVDINFNGVSPVIDIGADVFEAGTFIDIAYDTAEVQTTAEIIGVNIDLNTNLTAMDEGTLTGLKIITDGFGAATTFTTEHRAIHIANDGLNVASTGGIYNHTGIDIAIPNITQTSGTMMAQGININNGTITTGGTMNGINMSLAGVGVGGILNGVYLSLDSAGAGTETGVYILGSWNNAILVGASGATNNFSVSGTGVTTVNFNTTATTNGVCHSGDNINAASSTSAILVACSAAPADFAERYPVESGITYGDIVVPSNQTIITKDGDRISKLTKSNSPYQGPVAGIVSNNYSDFTSVGNNIYKEDNPMPVALVGRVPVNVTNENGSIKIGDFITTSSTPGAAMKATKAGRIIGMALDNWNGTSGQVMVQINNSWFNGDIDVETAEAFDYSDTYSQALFAELLSDKESLMTTLATVVSSSFADGLSTDTINSLSGLITFTHDAYFFGTPYFNKDTAGFTKILKGSSRVKVIFSKDYLAKPVVNASIALKKDDTDPDSISDLEAFIFNNNLRHLITNVSENGFEIAINMPAPQDINFSWTALAVK